MSAGEQAPEPPPAKPSLKQRLEAHFEEYGWIAIGTYFGLSIATIIGFTIAIALTTDTSSTGGIIAVIIAGWVAGKATFLIRVPITLALTPIVALVVRRIRRKREVHGEPPAASGEPPPASGGSTND